MATQKFMGRNQIVKRLTAQVKGKAKAIGLLKKHGLMGENGELTAKGKERNAMTAEERAKDREAKYSGRKADAYSYNPKTNRATLKRTK